MKNAKKVVSAFLALTCMFSIFSTQAYAAANMTPDYEVKFLLDTKKSLNGNYELNSEILSMFSMSPVYEPIAVEFVDTNGLDFNNAGWSNRIRHKNNGKEFEITYKKRYPVNGNDINSALNFANSEGFDAKETSYAAEIDWGYSKMTLSFSNDKTYSNAGYANLQLPNQNAAIAMLLEKLPGKVDKWLGTGWGTQMMNRSRVFGPLTYKKYTGTFQGKKTVIEIWPIKSSSGAGMEYAVEISFKSATFDEASSLRSNLMSYLKDRGILLPEDGLKTQSILERY